LEYRLWLVAALVLLGLPQLAGAHCDTLDGPVVAAARVALEKGDLTLVLRWVKQEHESEIRSAFARTRAVRGKGPEAQELADTYFLETLVRVHRAGEGAPYTGLKPAGTDLGPAVAGADAALEGGSVEGLVRLVTADVAAGIRERFARAAAARRHADESLEAGREYVETYVEYVHYVERVHAAAAGGALHGEPEAAAAEHHAH
jgi:hypothetical protein